MRHDELDGFFRRANEAALEQLGQVVDVEARLRELLDDAAGEHETEPDR